MRIVFMGTPESAVPSLRRLMDDGHEIVAVWTQPDRVAGRGQEQMREPPVKEFALAHNLHVEQPLKIKIEQTRHLFSSYNADVAVVVAYGRILPGSFLPAPKHGCLNVHFSLLPKYRGAAPVNWAIVNGEEQTGVTTMRIVERLDAGPILLQKATRIGDDETAPELFARLAEMGADLISETLRNLGHIEAKPQLAAEATYAPILQREDGLIDWSMDAFAIERRIRGFQPWPRAHTTAKGHRLIIWRANPRPSDGSGSPGQVIEAHGNRLVIACGNDTVLEVLELQAEGSRRMNALDFNNGARLETGGTLE